LRFWVATFLHGLACVKRWGKQVMDLYLHMIWIHWPKDFDKLEFVQEGTDCHEAWLATVKRILRYLTSKQQDESKLELIIRLAMEDFVGNETTLTDRSWNRIEKPFKKYKWKEYDLTSDHPLMQTVKIEWDCFFDRLKTAGFSQEAGDFVFYQTKQNKWGVRFKTLPL